MITLSFRHYVSASRSRFPIWRRITDTDLAAFPVEALTLSTCAHGDCQRLTEKVFERARVAERPGSPFPVSRLGAGSATHSPVTVLQRLAAQQLRNTFLFSWLQRRGLGQSVGAAPYCYFGFKAKPHSSTHGPFTTKIPFCVSMLSSEDLLLKLSIKSNPYMFSVSLAN